MEGYDDDTPSDLSETYDYDYPKGWWATSEWEKSQYVNGALWQYGKHVRNQIVHNQTMENPGPVIEEATKELEQLQKDLYAPIRKHQVSPVETDDADNDPPYERWFDPWGASPEDWAAHQAAERIRKQTADCGKSLQKLVRKCSSRAAYRRIFSQIIIDMRIEYGEALSNGRHGRGKLIVVAGCIAVARALLSEAWTRLLGQLLRKFSGS